MTDIERLLINSSENISQLLTIIKLHEESVLEYVKSYSDSYLDVSLNLIILQHVNQYIYQHINRPLNQMCPITNKLFLPLDEVIMLKCEHIFKRQSIINWVRHTNSCPVCRNIIIPL